MRPHPTEPISRPAFIASTLDARISESRALLLQAKNAVRYAATRADKAAARRAAQSAAAALAAAEAGWRDNLGHGRARPTTTFSSIVSGFRTHS